MDAVAIVSDEVRELIRREGLDPGRDSTGLRRLVEFAVAEYDERSLTRALPPLADPGQAIKRVLDEVSGFGALQPYLDDPSVEEIWINDPGRIFVSRAGLSELTTTVLTAQEVRDLVERMLKHSGRRVDLASPFVDAMLPDGSRLHVVIPDITRSAYAVNIRKFTVVSTRIDDLVTLGTLTPHAAEFLKASVVAGLNILVSGGTQAGKTTLLNCLLGAVPPRERIITCEEVFELRVALRDCVAMQCRQASLEGTGEVPLRRLVKEALRMRPNRLIVGEVRQAESLDLLLALNSGLPGMATVHANSAREAVVKMCTLPLLAGENVSARFIVPTVASSVDLVVQVRLDADGRRRVTEIIGVSGRVEGDVVETTEIFARRGDRLVRADGFPPHPERFEAAGIDIAAVLRGGWR
ncbi:Flp pilus assembly complex ATPase component TadA [Kineosporia rhizophila]|uniref:CpaF family protein n=1 Tax=Kineosporia TaxID=49184 RepID=UPI001E63547F|nr:ATPase, T2SS/T4P/T4SS family [Kineosporia sp. NBRC 101677]MCE0534828.1 Flp pilus assembly complex ATPase component TadA [Kineosporia rhizophila]GLY19242.1 pilus assembly protein CpaF [Kineosporia sp. NBRC 101677]